VQQGSGEIIIIIIIIIMTQWPGGESETKPVVVFIKDSCARDSHVLDSDEDAAVNERLHDVVGDITSSFSSTRHLGHLTIYTLLYREAEKRNQFSFALIFFSNWQKLVNFFTYISSEENRSTP